MVMVSVSWSKVELCPYRGFKINQGKVSKKIFNEVVLVRDNQRKVLRDICFEDWRKELEHDQKRVGRLNCFYNPENYPRGPDSRGISLQRTKR